MEWGVKGEALLQCAAGQMQFRERARALCVCVCLCRHRHLFTPTSLRCPASLSSANGLLVSSLSLVLCFLPQRIQVCLDLHWSQEDASNFLVGGDNQYVDQMGLLIQ